MNTTRYFEVKVTAPVELTQDCLKKNLHYDPETGIFTWMKTRGRARIGGIAGALRSDGRIQIRLESKYHLAHRLAWLYTYGKFPDQFIDHIDRNPSNNQISNLRECSASENMKNIGISKHNISGFKGVSLCKEHGKWQAQAHSNNKKKHLGYFNTPK